MSMDSVWIIEKSSAVIQSYDLSGPDDVFCASVVVQESAVGHRISSESRRTIHVCSVLQDKNNSG